MIYKILHGNQIFKPAFVILLNVYFLHAQSIVNKYGLVVLHDKNEFLTTIKNDSAKKMIELKSAIPGLVYELRYAGSNNFMHRRMYPKRTNTTFLRLHATNALRMVQLEINKNGYGLKIFDAYRPYSVTEKFWELIKDDRYVADPSKGSGHNRGIAVDLTIIDLNSGKELDMGTGFDNFTDSAHHNFTSLDKTILDNRKLLKETMEKNGFNSFDTEWWHYSWPNDRNYELLDLNFKVLKKLVKITPLYFQHSSQIVN